MRRNLKLYDEDLILLAYTVLTNFKDKAMANAVIPRMQGDDYQARFFWLNACRLFEDHSKVIRVGYELDTIRHFDDVALFYAQPIPDEHGDLINADYFQVKFHVSHTGSLTWEALIDPSFIGAASTSSLLQRLLFAQETVAPEGKGCRLHIVTPWSVASNDPLAGLISTQGGELRLHALFDGSGPRSTMGKIRTIWLEHLGLNDDTELLRVLRPLRLHTNAGDFEFLRDRLNDKLRLAGLLPVEDGCQVHPYDELIRKLCMQGRKEFTRDEIQTICEREGLWRGRRAQSDNATQIGVRSFIRWAEYMEDETDHMLCLVRHFDNRNTREPQLWQEAVFPELENFLSNRMRGQRPFHLHIDAHSSIAFATGYCLDYKAGVDVVPLQRTRSGKLLWRPSSTEKIISLPLWTCEEIQCSSAGNDVALAISVTHDVLNDVQLYVNHNLANLRKIVHCKVSQHPGSTAVRDGTHALLLAQELASLVKQQRSTDERKGVLHIFSAAPNALIFFLGQLARSFGRCVLYEYDFENNAPGAYKPSLSFPPPARKSM